MNRKGILPVLMFFAIFSSLPLPLRMSLSMYYFFFFFLGYCIGYNTIDVKKCFTKKHIITLSFLFLLTFPLLTHFRYDLNETYLANNISETIGEGISLTYSLLSLYTFQHCCQLVYSSIGVFLIYISVNYLIEHKVITVNTTIVQLSNYCFGVYLFQEFIIRIFYYKLGAIETINPYFSPLISIVLTIVLSITLTHFTLKTKIGKFLIG